MREIDTPGEFATWLAQAERRPAAVQALDLRGVPYARFQGDFTGCLFLGCRFESEAVAGHLVAAGGVVIPDLGLLFTVHRAQLYSVEELFAGFRQEDPQGYLRTWDARVFAQYVEHGRAEPRSMQVSLARRLHDHSITEALEELLEGRKVVAVMGGHGMERGDPFYASVARISRTLTREGFLMVSGGGPGAMEATHLGAWFAPRDDADLDEALKLLTPRPEGSTPGREYADPDWLHRAWDVRERYPIPPGRRADALSIGIPTWLYGHEPPAAFATHIAKYFANSVREDGLLAIAKHGVIFAPGSAGTTQEIFQDAAQNHYGTAGVYSPMILLGRRFWTEERPVWPLLERVSRDHIYGELVALTDREDAVIRRIRSYCPEVYAVGG